MLDTQRHVPRNPPIAAPELVLIVLVRVAPSKGRNVVERMITQRLEGSRFGAYLTTSRYLL